MDTNELSEAILFAFSGDIWRFDVYTTAGITSNSESLEISSEDVLDGVRDEP